MNTSNFISVKHKRIYLNTTGSGVEILNRAPTGTYFNNASSKQYLNKVKFDLEFANINCDDDEFLTIRLVKAAFSGPPSKLGYSYQNPYLKYSELVTDPFLNNTTTTKAGFISNQLLPYQNQGFIGGTANQIGNIKSLTSGFFLTQWETNVSPIEQKHQILINFVATGEEDKVVNYYVQNFQEATQMVSYPLDMASDPFQLRNCIRDAMVKYWTEADYNLTPIRIGNVQGGVYLGADDNWPGAGTRFLTVGDQTNDMGQVLKQNIGISGNYIARQNQIGFVDNSRPKLELPFNYQPLGQLYICADFPTDTYSSNKDAAFFLVQEPTQLPLVQNTSGSFSLQPPTTLNNIVGSALMFPQALYQYDYNTSVNGQESQGKGHAYNYIYENLTANGSEKRVPYKSLPNITLSLYDEYIRQPMMNNNDWSVELEITTFKRYPVS